MVRVRHPKDFYSGLLFIGFGIASLTIGSNYMLGSASRMGPGYFPRILGILLIVLGALLSLRALRIDGPKVPAFRWRPLIIFASVLAFGFMLERAGLVLSTIGLIIAASTASPEFRWKESVVSGFFFAALTVVVFVLALKLQLPIWPPALTLR